jgi:hypothetical protein
MAIFKKSGGSLSRAGAILEKLTAKAVTEAPEETSQDVLTDTENTDEGVPSPESIDTTVDAAEPAGDTVEGADTGGQEDVQTEVSNITTPDAVEVAAVPTPETVEDISDEVLFSKLSERLGKEVKSAEDLKSPQLDPELLQLMEWKEKTGLPLSEWTSYNRDFSKMGDMDVAREILAKEYPNFSKEEIDFSLKKFIYDEDVDDDRDKMSKSIELKKFAKKGRESLEAKRLELVSSASKSVLTPEQQEAIDFANQARKQSEGVKTQQEAYSKGIFEASKSLESIDLKLSDDLTIKYNIPNEVKQGLPKMISEMPNWYNPDGTYNHSNVVKDVAKVANFEAIMKSAYEQGIAVGTERSIKSSKNIVTPGSPSPDSGPPKKGNVTDVISNLVGSRSGNKLRSRTRK